jgi:catechol 2,3-dioxygenase-like lactoylglutathione lyase family enzyme
MAAVPGGSSGLELHAIIPLFHPTGGTCVYRIHQTRQDGAMTLLDHVVLQVDDLDAIGDWYDQLVRVAGGARTFDTPTLIGYALPGQPAQLFFSLATDPDGRQTHLALRVEDEATVRRGHEFATAAGAEILHEPRPWPEYGPDYYAVFIRDPAGNNLELKCHSSTAPPTHPATSEEIPS